MDRSDILGLTIQQMLEENGVSFDAQGEPTFDETKIAEVDVIRTGALEAETVHDMKGVMIRMLQFCNDTFTLAMNATVGMGENQLRLMQCHEYEQKRGHALGIIHSEYQKIQHNYNHQAQQFDQMVKENRGLKTTIAQQRKHINRLQSAQDEQKKKIEQMELAQNRRNVVVEDVMKNNRLLERTINQLQEQIQETTQTLTQQEETIQQLQETTQELAQTAAQQEETITQLQNPTQQEETIQQLQEQVQELAQTAAQQEETITQLQNPTQQEETTSLHETVTYLQEHVVPDLFNRIMINANFIEYMRYNQTMQQKKKQELMELLHQEEMLLATGVPPPFQPPHVPCEPIFPQEPEVLATE